MRFPKGDVPNKIMYGYRYNGKMVTSESGYEYKDIEIVEEEARVVRRIFHEVVEGKAYTEIARGLNMDKIPAPVTDAVRVRKKKSKKGQLNSDLLDGQAGISRGSSVPSGTWVQSLSRRSSHRIT